MLSITERSNRNTTKIDLADGAEIARLINAEDRKVALVIKKILPQIGQAVEEITARLRKGGRMAYFGSGTSGRIGVLDASEIPPTFGAPAEMVQWRGSVSAERPQPVRRFPEAAGDISLPLSALHRLTIRR